MRVPEKGFGEVVPGGLDEVGDSSAGGVLEAEDTGFDNGGFQV